MELAKENKDFNPLDNEKVLPNNKPKVTVPAAPVKKDKKDKKAKSSSTTAKDTSGVADI